MLKHGLKPYNKYGNKKTIVDGFKFDSKKEAAYYITLKARQEQGHIIFFLMQVPFHLDGGVVYKADFMVFYSNDTVEIVDVKGVKTDVYRIKKKQVEHKYKIKINEI